MNDRWLAFERRLAAAWPPAEWADVTVLVAVSGGPDSLALLRGLVAVREAGRGRLRVGHFNHGLRGDQAAEDARFVVRLCQQLDVPCRVGAGEKPRGSPAPGGLSEAASRRARYAFLQEEANRVGARYVVTAHTAEDQAETILHRILRGSGITGLAGMARARPLGPACTLLRPLLVVRRHELREYLEQIGQPFHQDPSNRDTRFTRNRIRHRLIPLLAREFNPGVIDAVLRLGQLAGEVNAVIAPLVEGLIQRHVQEDPSGGVQIQTESLADQPRYLVRQLMMAVWQRQAWPQRAMGFAQWDRLADLVTAAGNTAPKGGIRINLPGAIRAESAEGWVRLVPETR